MSTDQIETLRPHPADQPGATHRRLPSNGSFRRNHPMALRCRRVGAVHSIMSVGSLILLKPLCRLLHAILIQESIRRDSIVSNFNSTVSLRRFFQQHLPKADSCSAAKPDQSTVCAPDDAWSLPHFSLKIGKHFRNLVQSCLFFIQ